MTRSIVFTAIAVVAAACPGKQKAPTTTGEPLPAKRITVNWGFEPNGANTDVYLSLTDETGKQTSHSVGSFPGKCQRSNPKAELHALTAAICIPGSGFVDLEVVVQGGSQLVVLELDSANPDPMANKRIKEISFPLGAAVEASPQ